MSQNVKNNAIKEEDMETREWHSVDKSDWGPGLWEDEPDKVQWVDEGTGLDCLIVRGPGGQLCGYVGVPPEHPWHGLDYDACYMGDDCDSDPDRLWCDHRPTSLVDVHGGLTFASSCSEPDRASYEATREKAKDPALIALAAKHPNGEAAERLERCRRALTLSYEEWRDEQMGQRICHVPEEGRPDDVWWFGFDCAHLGDATPAFARHAPVLREEGVYRGRRYVEGEVRSMARQLADVA